MTDLLMMDAAALEPNELAHELQIRRQLPELENQMMLSDIGKLRKRLEHEKINGINPITAYTGQLSDNWPGSHRGGSTCMSGVSMCSRLRRCKQMGQSINSL